MLKIFDPKLSYIWKRSYQRTMRQRFHEYFERHCVSCCGDIIHRGAKETLWFKFCCKFEKLLRPK